MSVSVFSYRFMRQWYKIFSKPQHFSANIFHFSIKEGEWGALFFLKFLNLLPHCHRFPETPCLWAKRGGSKVAAGGSKMKELPWIYHELYVEDKNRKNLFPRCIPNICVAGSSKTRNWQLEGDEQAVRRSRLGSSSGLHVASGTKVCHLRLKSVLLRSVKWAT